MNDKQKVDAYFKKHAQWNEQLAALRKVLLGAKLMETVKWGSPSYTLQDKIVVSLVGFKRHCALWFHQGVFLADKSKQLVSANEESTRGLRQWRFQSGDKVDSKLVKAYVAEAIANQLAGKQIRPKKKTLTLPPELGHALGKNTKLNKAFYALTPGKQNEYAEHIAAAKQEKTRLARVQKITPMILAGGGLNDKYRGS